jgi:peptide/nickel transport system permease protein
MQGPDVAQRLEPADDAAVTAAVADHPAEDADHEYQHIRKGFWFWLAIGWLAFILCCVLFSQWFPFLPDATERVGDPRLSPSWDYPFGTNNRGQSVLARTIHGARISIGVAVLATLGGLLLGGAIGIIAGFYRRTLDTFLMGLVNVMLAIPGLVLALALVGFFAPSGGFEEQRFLIFWVSPATNATIWTTIALAILATPSIARVARAQTLVWSDREFVLASRTIGTRTGRIIRRDVLPNVLPAMVGFALIGIAALIVVQAALSFFGVGDVTATTWGGDINFGRDRLDEQPHMVLFPALFMFLTVLALNYLADRLAQLTSIREAGV